MTDTVYNHVARIYVPTNRLTDTTLFRLADVAGGVTSTPCNGTWRNGPDIVTESVVVLTVWYTTDRRRNVHDCIDAIVRELLAAGEQAVLREVNGIGVMSTLS